MADVINRGKIIIDLEAGKVDLPVPNYDQIVAPQKQHVDLIKQEEAATESLTRAVANQNAEYRAKWAALNQLGRESMREGQGDKKWDAGLDRMKAAAAAAGEAERAELEKANQAILADRVKRQQQEEAINQQILADRVRRHQQNLARIEAEKRAEQQAIQERISQQRAMGEALNNLTEGFMKVTRSAILLGFAQDESLQDLLRNLALAQGAFDLFNGSRKIIQSLRDMMAQAAIQGKSLWQAMGAGNAVLALTVAAITAIAMAWELATRKQKAYQEGAKGARESQKSISQDIASLSSVGERIRMAEDATRTHNVHNITGNSAGNSANLARQAQMDLLQAKQDDLAVSDDLLSKQQENIRNAERQLDLARNKVKTEEDAIRAYEAAYSKLQGFEQKQLKAALDKARAGKDLTDYETSLVEKVGQSGVAERERAKEGRREGANAAVDLNGLEGATVGTTGSLSEFQKELDAATKKLAEMTDGKGADAAITVIEQQRDELRQKFAEFQAEIISNLKEIRKKLKEAQKQNADIASASTGGGGTGGGGGGF